MGEECIFQRDNVAVHRLITYVFWIIYRVHQTLSISKINQRRYSSPPPNVYKCLLLVPAHLSRGYTTVNTLYNNNNYKKLIIVLIIYLRKYRLTSSSVFIHAGYHLCCLPVNNWRVHFNTAVLWMHYSVSCIAGQLFLSAPRRITHTHAHTLYMNECVYGCTHIYIYVYVYKLINKRQTYLLPVSVIVFVF